MSATDTEFSDNHVAWQVQATQQRQLETDRAVSNNRHESLQHGIVAATIAVAFCSFVLTVRSCDVAKSEHRSDVLKTAIAKGVNPVLASCLAASDTSSAVCVQAATKEK